MRALPVLVLLAACQAAPRSQPEIEADVVEAERLLAGGDPSGAHALLVAVDQHSVPRALQPRLQLTLARSQFQLGDCWDAFLTIRDFPDEHPHSPLRDQVMALQFEIGRTLVRRDGGFLFFWSDRAGGRSCLEHLITRYPESPYLADALRTLGELDYENGDYKMAQERFRDLLRRRPESEWAPFARFRFAMSIVSELHGSDYDLDQMQHATKEMVAFLENPPENPLFVAEAKEALARLLRWQAERHVAVADFYRTVGNRAGEIVHLQKATVPELAATEAAAEARERLQALQAPAPPQPAPEAAPGGGQ